MWVVRNIDHEKVGEYKTRTAAIVRVMFDLGQAIDQYEGESCKITAEWKNGGLAFDLDTSPMGRVIVYTVGRQ